MFAKFFSLYFLLGSLIPGTNFSDLVHLPDLVEHYRLHVREAEALNETYSFARFIDDHFLNPDHHVQSGHENDHENLPLHSFSPGTFILVEFVLSAFDTAPFQADFQYHYINPGSQGCAKTIFQPPI